jgi:hypothetical protein
MVCPKCNHTNSEASGHCEKCATPLPLSEQTLLTGVRGWSVPAGEIIIRLLGQGVMGAVYQAHDRELEREVALKVIRGEMAANPEILKRFKRELTLARQITHKNVIRIFDLGQVDEIKFMSMEYIEGEDLQSALRRKKKLEPAEAAVSMAQVCRALEAAHNVSDVEPAGGWVMVRPGGKFACVTKKRIGGFPPQVLIMLGSQALGPVMQLGIEQAGVR